MGWLAIGASVSQVLAGLAVLGTVGKAMIEWWKHRESA
jgi:predicted benzoate:H+ symporter BenE